MADTTIRIPTAGGSELALKAIDNGDSSYSLDLSKQYLRHGALGHYKVSTRFSMATSQNAASRLFEIRNTGANLLVPLRCMVSVLPAGTITAAYRAQFALHKATGFSAVDTVNTVTPVAIAKRLSDMAAAPGGAAIRHVTVAGAAAGMTGGTITESANALSQLTAWVATAAATTYPVEKDLLASFAAEHPLVLAANEGVTLQNVAAGSATANVLDVTMEFAWAEVAAF
jgi:hypothetical protein